MCGNEDADRQTEVETDGREQLRRQGGETAALQAPDCTRAQKALTYFQCNRKLLAGLGRGVT